MAAAFVFALAAGGAALAQSTGSSGDSGNSSSAGGSSVSSGSSESSASISVSGGASVGVTQGTVAEGSTAGGSSSSRAGNRGGSSSSSGSSSDSGAAVPSAVNGGVVSTNLELPATELGTQPASDAGANLLTWVGVALIVVGFTVLYLRLPHGRAV